MSRLCQVCAVASVESGFDECRQCLVDMVENDPKQLECFLDQNEILGWIAEAREQRRNPVPVPQLMKRQAGFARFRFVLCLLIVAVVWLVGCTKKVAKEDCAQTPRVKAVMQACHDIVGTQVDIGDCQFLRSDYERLKQNCPDAGVE